MGKVNPVQRQGVWRESFRPKHAGRSWVGRSFDEGTRTAVGGMWWKTGESKVTGQGGAQWSENSFARDSTDQDDKTKVRRKAIFHVSTTQSFSFCYKGVHVLISGTCECYLSGTLQIWLRILRWGDYPGLSGRHKVITRALPWDRRSRRVRGWFKDAMLLALKMEKGH